MKRRFTDEQIIGFLKEAEAGTPVEELCPKHGFSDAAFYGWRSRFGGMEVADAARLRNLEAENNRLNAYHGPRVQTTMLRRVWTPSISRHMSLSFR